MRKERLIAANKVAENLFDAEAAIDVAISKASALAQTLPEVRQDVGIAATIGQDALESVVNALPALATARSCMVSAHMHLDSAKDEIGLKTVSFGTPGGKPNGLLSQEPELRIVKTTN